MNVQLILYFSIMRAAWRGYRRRGLSSWTPDGLSLIPLKAFVDTRVEVAEAGRDASYGAGRNFLANAPDPCHRGVTVEFKYHMLRKRVALNDYLGQD